ncbi:hypothetical protein ACH5RR_026259 [Cinchona calisaya]|uniref:Aminotransferase-like plant mobile domain-containing protein n=1 Tax=Cinchona calisaya TaxID=153742 RepID=A0ABD2Z624_9GENT
MTPTILDIGILTSLRPHGKSADYNLSLVIDRADFGHSFKSHKSYSLYLAENFKGIIAKDKPISKSKDISFLAFWLNQYIFCLLIAISFFNLATVLADGEALALASAIVSALYRSLAEFKTRKLEDIHDPMWILQLWLQSYFASMRPASIDENAPNTIFRGLDPPSKCRSKRFSDYVDFFYCDSQPFIAVLISRQNLSISWLINLYPTQSMSEKDEDERVAIRASCAVTRNLHFGCRLVPYKSIVVTNIGAKFYLACFVSCQFGLIQSIPALFPYPINQPGHRRHVFSDEAKFDELQAQNEIEHLRKERRHPKTRDSYKCPTFEDFFRSRIWKAPKLPSADFSLTYEQFYSTISISTSETVTLTGFYAHPGGRSLAANLISVVGNSSIHLESEKEEIQLPPRRKLTHLAKHILDL